MTMSVLQRAAFLAAVYLFAQHPRDATAFGVNPLAANRFTLSQSALWAEPSPSAKAAELRQKAQEAKRKAEELKKVAEQKAEAAMMAVKRANEKKEMEKAEASPTVAAKVPTPPSPSKESRDKASTRVASDPSDGAIIPINAANVEFTSGILGGALALAFGASPIFAVVAAAASNYIAKKDDLGEVNELVQGLSKASLNTVNWFARLDSKYLIVGKLSESLDNTLNDLKNSEGKNAETVRQLEDTVSKTTKQIQQLANEIDLIEGGKQALGAVGEVLETSIDKAFDANKEYKLTERATGAAKKAIEKVKDGQP